jgi:hypothetical protein
MVIQAATGRLNMQVVMTGWLACVVLSHPQPSLLLDQQSPAGPEPPRLAIGSSGTGYPLPGSSVHVSRSISVYLFGQRSALNKAGGQEGEQTEIAVPTMREKQGKWKKITRLHLWVLVRAIS